MAGDERQDAALPLDGQTARVRDDFNRVNGSAREAIDRVEHLKRSNQIELVDRWHNDDDDPAA